MKFFRVAQITTSKIICVQVYDTSTEFYTQDIERRVIDARLDFGVNVTLLDIMVKSGKIYTSVQKKHVDADNN